MPNNEDAAFMEVLASCNEAAEQMDYADDGWMPDDGEYTVILVGYTIGTKAKNDVVHGYGKPLFRILDGDFKDRSFTDFMWLPPNPSEPSPGLRQMLRLGTCLCDRELHNAAEASTIIKEAADAGEVLNVEVFTTVSKSNGKAYTNIRYKSRIAASAPPTEAPKSAS